MFRCVRAAPSLFVGRTPQRSLDRWMEYENPSGYSYRNKKIQCQGVLTTSCDKVQQIFEKHRSKLKIHRRQNGDMEQVSYLWPRNIRCHCTQLRRLGHLAPRIYRACVSNCVCYRTLKTKQRSPNWAAAPKQNKNVLTSRLQLPEFNLSGWIRKHACNWFVSQLGGISSTALNTRECLEITDF
jgi:hypothetical protein